jgi:hypothetical protein
MFRRMVVSCCASLDVATGWPKITRDELLCWLMVQSTFFENWQGMIDLNNFRAL